MSNFDNIIQEINTNLPDNTTQEITAIKLRTTMIDLTETIDEVLTPIDENYNDIINQLPYTPGGVQTLNVDMSSAVWERKAVGGNNSTTRVRVMPVPIPTDALSVTFTFDNTICDLQVYPADASGVYNSANPMIPTSFETSGTLYISDWQAVLSQCVSTNNTLILSFRKHNDPTATLTLAQAQSSFLGGTYTKYTVGELLPVATKEELKKEISILFIGNSLTQDAISYVPYVLNRLNNDQINFKFYMWYNGGYTLEQQWNAISSNTAAGIFSVCENSSSWTNYNNSITLQSVLSTYTFDIVCLQEYFNYKTSFTVDDLAPFNNIVDYIRSNYSGNFKVITLLHAPLRSSAATVLTRTIDGNKLILENTVAQDMLSPGLAIYKAMSTSLDSLGDQSHLSPDGTHAQEGLPCLIEALNCYLWIVDYLGLNNGVCNTGITITTSIYNSINVPGPNLGTGVIPGTQQQNLIGADCAIQAYNAGKGIVNTAFSEIYNS